MDITEHYRMVVLAQRTSREVEYRKSDGARLDLTSLQTDAIQKFEEAWKTLAGRLAIVPGKDVLGELRSVISDRFGVSLTDARIIRAVRPSDLPADFLELFEKLELFRVAAVV
jgi:hypothetical protein